MYNEVEEKLTNKILQALRERRTAEVVCNRSLLILYLCMYHHSLEQVHLKRIFLATETLKHVCLSNRLILIEQLYVLHSD